MFRIEDIEPFGDDDNLPKALPPAESLGGDTTPDAKIPEPTIEDTKPTEDQKAVYAIVNKYLDDELNLNGMIPMCREIGDLLTAAETRGYKAGYIARGIAELKGETK